jgi:serine/threonine protein kinase
MSKVDDNKGNPGLITDIEDVSVLSKITLIKPPSCQPQSDDRAVIIKKPKNRFGELALYNECRIFPILNHPNIIKPIKYCEIEKVIITPYCSGGDMLTWLTRNPPLDQKIDICIDIVKACCYLHELKTPIVHLDLKPENVLMTDQGGVLIDFGTAMMLDRHDQAKSVGDLTSPLTPRYAAPEIQKIIPQSGDFGTYNDIYSIGCILYIICYGKTLWDNFQCTSGILQLWGKVTNQQQLDAELQRYTSGIRTADLRLKALCYDCMLYDPKARPTARQLLEQLKSIAQQVLKKSPLCGMSFNK